MIDELSLTRILVCGGHPEVSTLFGPSPSEIFRMLPLLTYENLALRFGFLGLPKYPLNIAPRDLLQRGRSSLMLSIA